MTTPHTHRFGLRKSYNRVTQTPTNTLTLRTATTSARKRTIDHTVDPIILLWHLENSSLEYTRADTAKYTCNQQLHPKFQILASKMDQNAKPNITVNK